MKLIVSMSNIREVRDLRMEIDSIQSRIKPKFSNENSPAGQISSSLETYKEHINNMRSYLSAMKDEDEEEFQTIQKREPLKLLGNDRSNHYVNRDRFDSLKEEKENKKPKTKQPSLLSSNRKSDKKRSRQSL